MKEKRRSGGGCPKNRQRTYPLTTAFTGLVRLLYFEDMTVKKTAEIFGCSRKTIHNRREKVLEKIRKMMSETSPWKEITPMPATERNRCQEDRGIPEREAWGYAAKASWHKVHGLSLCSRKGAAAPFPASGEDGSGQSPAKGQGIHMTISSALSGICQVPLLTGLKNVSLNTSHW